MNHLAETQSLYLRKHAENPINWWYWCDQALELARSQDKLIFLSIGYSSCHWCTVMEEEAFSDTVIANYINEHFIAIKVDREERPDLDSIYMQALQIMGENGGWPLNMFLTPDDLIPFYGGTYFPIEARYGRPSFLRVLQSLHQTYTNKRQELLTYKSQIMQNLQAINQLQPSPIPPQEILNLGVQKCSEVVQNRGQGNCFPMIPYADLVLRRSRFQDADILGSKAKQRGLDLALGGIFDHVAGGWHRYTVDSDWTVPHFEKMLYDNGQIMEYLANLWSAGIKEDGIKVAIARTVEWLQREMTAEEGYFYASQDADSEGREGKFWVWSYQELERILTKSELQALTKEFTITPAGNFEGNNVLKRRYGSRLSSNTESALDKLFNHRYGQNLARTDIFPPACDRQAIKNRIWQGRVPPVTDPKMIVAWNALMISGLIRAYIVFDQEIYRQLAVNAITFILQNQWQVPPQTQTANLKTRLHRVNYGGNPAVLGHSEDYALLIKALLDLTQACPNSIYLNHAIRVQAEFDQYLWDADHGGYFNTDINPDLLIREKTYMDNATPAANGIAIANLIRLSLLTENLEYLDRAEKALQVYAGAIANSPIGVPSLITALDWWYNQTLVRTTKKLYLELQANYNPVIILQEVNELPQRAIAMVCRGLACLAPATNIDMFKSQVAITQTRT
ncbi:thioredoxin domain protein [Synechococcus sp. PCC 7502]|uniref:thioredoxin domain-containing protein n=1 Tax=Synechococcus sp. PCC 7502 TaxID=1173263 RepID=UPI00029FD29A|nr:thioredoxin domain-containing protein [Synechococcus sp. PCC 7502]AFY72880.1 thioredoxin domain protein [Synechococcus sp. PCC 7502]